jgi:thiamine biosynthesis lipoprotein
MRAGSRFFTIVALLAALAFLSPLRAFPACAAAPQKFSAQFFDTFDTLVTFTAFAADKAEFERYANAVHGEMRRLHELFDIYHGYDGLVNMKSLNDAAGKAPLRVDRSIIDLLDLGISAYEDTGKTVNIALGPVLSIWHEYRRRALSEDVLLVPAPEDLIAAAKHVLPGDIVIDREKSTVFLRYPDMRLDVGAIAKGFAVRSATERARKAGLKSGLINAGGNVSVIGGPLDGRKAWNVGVRAPFGGDMSELVDVLELDSGSAVTSGNDQRYYMAGGRRYHHIIDPATLFPAEGVTAVTVLHPDSALADVLSTAAFILPYDKARALVAKHGAEAIWILPDGTKTVTPGYVRLSKLAREKKPPVNGGVGTP